MRVEPRVVRIVTRQDGDRLHVRAAVEDRFHHFRVWADADRAAGKVVACGVDPVRFPYTGCPTAGGRVSLLVGMPLGDRASDYFRHLDARQQCTHQIDVIALALAMGTRGVAERRYDMQIELDGAATLGKLWQDGAPALEMRLEGTAILSPPSFAGRDIGAGFTSFVATLDAEAADAALALRRMLFVGQASAANDAYERMTHAPVTGGCWVQQRENAPFVERLHGQVLPPATDPARLTEADAAFLITTTHEDITS